MLSLFWGFRLTMWYVKINKNKANTNTKKSFRLTMWYVKYV